MREMEDEREVEEKGWKQGAIGDVSYRSACTSVLVQWKKIIKKNKETVMFLKLLQITTSSVQHRKCFIAKLFFTNV